MLNVTKTTDNTRVENNILDSVIRSLARIVSVACQREKTDFSKLKRK